MCPRPHTLGDVTIPKKMKQIAYYFIRVGPIPTTHSVTFPFLDDVQIQGDCPSLCSLCVTRQRRRCLLDELS